MSKRRDGKGNSYINVSFQGENVSRFDGAHFPFLIKSFAELKNSRIPEQTPEGFLGAKRAEIPLPLKGLRRDSAELKIERW